ncbi:antirestriction protein [Shewanella avicenniae]|uniref:Antirestriction protein n=1 Tax=Shewanella avicenniae TaxID=2814294 RepID=A0ABX7QP26_9GAMM|nr:antirestriction protein [Shewanella avicenniae]QSX32466.1 antirestriction protein [Shewanella avicenniae]
MSVKLEAKPLTDVLKTPHEIKSYLNAVVMVLNESLDNPKDISGGLYLLGEGFAGIFSFDGRDPRNPDAEKVMVAWSGNYFQGLMSPFALNVGANIMASSILAFSATGTFQERLSDNVYNLKNYAETLSEAEKIFRYID